MSFVDVVILFLVLSFCGGIIRFQFSDKNKCKRCRKNKKNCEMKKF